MSIPPEIHGRTYISLASFRRNGAAVPTPIWFGEKDGKLYVMTRSDSGKYKRIRNNPHVRIAPCTVRGKITGPEFAAARSLPLERLLEVSMRTWLPSECPLCASGSPVAEP